MPPGQFEGLESNLLQRVFPRLNRWGRRTSVQAPDACRGTVDDQSEVGAEFRRAVFEQALLRFFSGEPGRVPIRFLRRFEPRHFAEMSGDGKFRLGKSGSSGSRALSRSCSVGFATAVTSEGDFFHPAMNPSLFKSLEGSGLGVGEAGFNTAFGENPTTAAGLNQQEFDAAFTDPITNGGDLLPFLRKP